MATSSVNTVQQLKEKQSQAQEAANAINNDPKFQSLRDQTATLFQESRRLSAEADAAFKAGNSELSNQLSAQATAASDQSLAARREFNVLYKISFKIVKIIQCFRNNRKMFLNNFSYFYSNKYVFLLCMII
jgi:hypothetical protein